MTRPVEFVIQNFPTEKKKKIFSIFILQINVVGGSQSIYIYKFCQIIDSVSGLGKEKKTCHIHSCQPLKIIEKKKFILNLFALKNFLLF